MPPITELHRAPALADLAPSETWLTFMAVDFNGTSLMTEKIDKANSEPPQSQASEAIFTLQ
ncbi:hypothetical protein H2202_011255 [Exophiala xenobiotica]|nr:hypothetical protein H2202_011255 [Exophiala xenobiotica]